MKCVVNALVSKQTSDRALKTVRTHHYPIRASRMKLECTEATNTVETRITFLAAASVCEDLEEPSTVPIVAGFQPDRNTPVPLNSQRASDPDEDI